MIKVSFFYLIGETVARTLGAKNKSSRELRAEAKRLIEKANYQDRIEKLKNEAQKKK